MATSSSGPSATLDLFDSSPSGGGGGGTTTNDDDIVLQGSLSGGPTAPSASSSMLSSSGMPPPGANTLDEPIKETVLRDLRAVGQKFLHVLYPVEKKSLLREWDLWGPLILCTLMAAMLQGHDTSGDKTQVSGDGGPEFAEVFVIVWAGAVIVTLNTKLLGGSISFFQSVCVLGYCLLPLAISLVVCRALLMAHQNTVLFLIRYFESPM